MHVWVGQGEEALCARTVPSTFLGVRFLSLVWPPSYPPHPACAAVQHYDSIAGGRAPANARTLIYESMRLPRYATFDNQNNNNKLNGINANKMKSSLEHATRAPIRIALLALFARPTTTTLGNIA